jgi:cytochrome c5
MYVWKKITPRITLVLLLLLLIALEAPAQGQGAEASVALPEGPGKELVAASCSRCHAIDVVTSRKKSRSQWESTINDMISRGAQISGDETRSIAQYLGEHFNPDGRASAGITEAGAAFPEAPGKEVLMSKCFQCHNEGMWKTLRQDKKGWETTLYPMVGRGALWTEEEISTMAQYLATAFGPKTAGKPQSQRREK